jgi:hypothetical protein
MRLPCDACIDPSQGLGILAEKSVHDWSTRSSVVMSEGRHTSVPVVIIEPPLDHRTWLNHCWTKLTTFFRPLYSNGFVNVCDNSLFIILILYRTLSFIWHVFMCTKFRKLELTNCHYTKDLLLYYYFNFNINDGGLDPARDILNTTLYNTNEIICTACWKEPSLKNKTGKGMLSNTVCKFTSRPFK